MGSSTEPDRSLSSGITIPQWMKNKINDRYDIDETFSPPTNDDTFFYIRYPKSTQSKVLEPVKVIEENKSNPSVQNFSQHTLACQKFVSPAAAAMSSGSKDVFVDLNAPRLKSQGSDEKAENGACGKSVVDVAKQMMSGKSVIRGFSIAGSNDNLAVPESGFDPKMRRGSKSLPASPLGSPSHSPNSSPRSRRRVAHPNRYFTGTFAVPEKAGIEESGSRYLGSWIWSGFLGQREGTPAITEEENAEKANAKRESYDLQHASNDVKVTDKPIAPISTLVSFDMTKDQNSDSVSLLGKLSSDDQKNVKLQPKPSELREMNFWSPTSM